MLTPLNIHQSSDITMKYFAYGSNLNHEHMLWRCKDASCLGAHTLHGYRLVFRCYADIIPLQENSVKGGLWEISESDEAALDRYEGYPKLYEKYYEGEIMFYRMREENREYGLPSNGYLEDLLEGMENFGLDPIVDLSSNLGNTASQTANDTRDKVQHAMKIIADALALEL